MKLRVAPQLRGLSDAELAREVRERRAYLDGDTIVPFSSGAAVCSTDWETGVHGNNITTADAGSPTAVDLGYPTSVAGTGLLKYDNTHPAFGTLAAKMSNPAGAGIAWFEWFASLGNVTTHYGRAYIWLTAAPTTTNCCIIRMLTSGGLDGGQIIITTGGKLKVQDGAQATTATGSVNVATGQPARIEWKLVNSATVGETEAKLFNTASATSPDETIVLPVAGNNRASADKIRIGINTDGNSVSNAMAIWYDQVVAGAASYPGPFVPPVTRRRRRRGPAYAT